MDKIQVYHFHNGSGGGVLSVIKNLLKFSNNQFIENHVIHAVNKNEIPDYKIEHIEGAVSQQLFFYSGYNNFYYTCKQLAKLLPNDKALIIAHDWVELGMVSNLGLQNKVVQYLHGDFSYYYELAVKNKNIIDSFICISPVIYNKLKKLILNREGDITYLNFPVQAIEQKKSFNKTFNIVYYVRDLTDIRKQFSTIIGIANRLKEDNQFFFTIAGAGFTEASFHKAWPQSLKVNVKYLGSISNEDILQILQEQDVFLLPSLSEGLPVSLIEAMKTGVVPLVSKWDGAVDELIIPGTSGYYLEVGDIAGYVETIKHLSGNKMLLNNISNTCSQKANLLFDPYVNTIKMENIFKFTREKYTLKKSRKVFGSKLDQIWIPNLVTIIIRKSLKLFG